LKVLITGGTGTVGKALIKQNDNEYINVSRNEEKIAELKREYPEVKSYVGNIEDKGLLLRVFMNSNNDINRFALTRFANVAHSNGSVLPFWLKLKKQGNPLKLTDPDMNRLIFTQEDAAQLINRTIKWTHSNGGGFVKSYKMKCVNMLDLAMFIADEEVPIDIVGKRPGEKTNEDLVGEREIHRTYLYGDDIHIRMEDNTDTNKLSAPYNSKTAPNMTEEELQELVYG